MGKKTSRNIMKAQFFIFSLFFLPLFAFGKIVIDVPAEGKTYSGIGIIHGHATGVGDLELSFDGKAPISILPSFERRDAPNATGFAIAFNYNLLTNGLHTLNINGVKRSFKVVKYEKDIGDMQVTGSYPMENEENHFIMIQHDWNTLTQVVLSKETQKMETRGIAFEIENQKDQAVELVNSIRRGATLCDDGNGSFLKRWPSQEVTWNWKLSQAAQRHSADLLLNVSEGPNPSDRTNHRILAEYEGFLDKYEASIGRESLRGESDLSAVIAQMMETELGCKLITNTEAAYFGVSGMRDNLGGVVYTLHFGK